jgi:acyl-ACP thioesterase
MDLEIPLAPLLETGRVFRAQRRIRLSDTTATGRLRLDAVARYLQDIATDDVDDAGTDDTEHVWVVRRTVLDVLHPFDGDSAVSLATWASGVGPRWATRRTRVEGDASGCIEAESLWVHLHRQTLQPHPMPERFQQAFGASGLPRVSGRLLLPSDVPGETERTSWPVRVTDIDIMGHVNNAVYWGAIEAVLPSDLTTYRAVLEYREPIDLHLRVTLAVERGSDALNVWFLARGRVAAVAGLARTRGQRDAP